MKHYVAAAVIGASALVACGGGGGLTSSSAAIAPQAPSATPVPTATPSPTPSLAPLPLAGPYAALGDSITAGQYVTQPFPVILAATLGGLTVTNLGGNGRTAPDVLNDEIPLVPSGCVLVTLDIGINDVTKRFQSGSETEAQFEASYVAVLGAVRAACPTAHILVGTLIDNTSFTGDVAGDVTWQHPYIMTINAFVRGLSGVTVVDLDADPRLHDAANLVDYIHPNQVGMAIVAQDFALALSGTAAKSSLRR